MTATQHYDKPVSRWTRTVRALQHFNKVLAGFDLPAGPIVRDHDAPPV